jgi:hypothetical protein
MRGGRESVHELDVPRILEHTVSAQVKDRPNNKLGQIFRAGGMELGIEWGLLERRNQRRNVGWGWHVQHYQNLMERLVLRDGE